jgi:outer membrane protein OmpA-like peptidoglycan-associated protein
MPDGAGLFFCRKNHGSGQDIYAAYKKGSGYEVRPLPAPVNTNTHEVPINISFDKSLFVFFGNYGTLPQYKDVLQAGSLGRGDLFYSALREEKFGINVFPPPLNSPDYEGGLCFTADGKAAIFVSDRTGAVGGYFPKSPPNRLFYHGGEDFNTDLWISFKKNDTWSEPVNLGNLNTPFAESNPYLHPDMKTIYFVSDGHAGLGGGDIFVATRLDDTWQNWSEPQNLGKSVNTPEKDGFFTDAYGQFAYIALKNKKPSFGGSDIYRFEIPERFRPKKTVKITGNLLHEGKGTSGKIIVEDLADGKKVSETYADAKTGKFEFELQSGKNYGVFSEKSGFYGESASLSMTDKNNKANLRLETSSIKELIEKQKPLRLVNIFFETNSAELLPESESELRRLADMLRENKNLKIRVEGHTDNTGNANANLVLSERRAQSVADFLIRQGVPEDRVFYKGFGQEYPIADNKTEEGRAKNRRVEFSLKAR